MRGYDRSVARSTAAQVGRLWRLGRAYTTVICLAPGYAHDIARPGRDPVARSIFIRNG